MIYRRISIVPPGACSARQPPNVLDSPKPRRQNFDHHAPGSPRKKGAARSRNLQLAQDAPLWPATVPEAQQRGQSKACMLLVVEVFGGASRDRTDDLIVANDALSQLSYSPTNRRDPGTLRDRSRAMLPWLAPRLYRQPGAIENRAQMLVQPATSVACADDRHPPRKKFRGTPTPNQVALSRRLMPFRLRSVIPGADGEHRTRRLAVQLVGHAFAQVCAQRNRPFHPQHNQIDIIAGSAKNQLCGRAEQHLVFGLVPKLSAFRNERAQSAFRVSSYILSLIHI